ncbi:hypothetical protein J6590_010149 [Homalodisca vitripennis]|nr:hypothetical protein J6590_010149 [Homalodisca vitripennis]
MDINTEQEKETHACVRAADSKSGQGWIIDSTQSRNDCFDIDTEQEEEQTTCMCAGSRQQERAMMSGNSTVQYVETDTTTCLQEITGYYF